MNDAVENPPLTLKETAMYLGLSGEGLLRFVGDAPVVDRKLLRVWLGEKLGESGPGIYFSSDSRSRRR